MLWSSLIAVVTSAAPETEAFIPLSVDSSMLDLMVLLGKYGNHRVAVVDKDSMVRLFAGFWFSLLPCAFQVNLITQSAVVRALTESLDTNELLRTLNVC